MVTAPPPGRSTEQQPPWWLLFVVMALVGFLVSAAVVRLPYFAFRPGSVRDTRPLFQIQGAETYEPEGSINYTTVSLRQVTLAGLVAGWLDPDVDIVDEDRVVVSDDPEEQRRLNLAQMATSKEIATLVALEKLGYEVPASATGEVVLEVSEGMPAQGVLERGDIIVAVDGERIDEPDDLAEIMADKGPGDEVALQVDTLDSNEDESVSMELAEDPDQEGRGIMGVQVMATGVQFDFPVDVAVETGDVGGPSAGLAFTLALIDQLTQGELTGGANVAVTGEILLDGSVGQVGGVGQKAAAARSKGMDVFLVPQGEGADARPHAGDMEVIEVATLDDALAALSERGGNGLDLPDLGGEESQPK